MSSQRAHPDSSAQAVYLLPKHHSELERVTTQHEFILSYMQLLLKTPLPEVGSEIRILDSGCSDGVWLRAVREMYSEYQWDLHGLDLHTSYFPSKEAMKDLSLDLRAHDIREDVPENWGYKESFDIVHQRLLVFGLTKPAWPLVMDKLFSLTKAGGWIQMVEIAWIDDENLPDARQTPALAKVVIWQQWMCDQNGMDIYIAQGLEQLLKKAGCENVKKYEFDFGAGRKAREEKWMEPSIKILSDVVRSSESRIPNEGIPGVIKSKAELTEFADAYEKEIREFGYSPKIYVVVGQRPA